MNANQAGQQISAAQQLMTIVPPGDVWLTANFTRVMFQNLVGQAEPDSAYWSQTLGSTLMPG